MQTEYRKETKNSSHILDFSLNKTDNDNSEGRKTHFFSNSKFNFDTDYFDLNIIDLKIEKISNDNYAQLYSLESTSPIIKDTNFLENLIKFSGSNDDLDFEISLESYETMNKPNSDRFNFYPNYFIKIDFFDDKLINSYDFISSEIRKNIQLINMREFLLMI